MLTQVPHQKQNQQVNHQLKKQFVSSKYSQKILSLNTTLMDSLCDDIQSQRIVIPQKQKPFRINSIEAQQDKIKLQMSGLIQKKQQIENQLKKIQIQEYKLHINQSRYGLDLNQSKISLNNTNSAERMFRSELTEQEKQKIRQVIKNQKKFIKITKQKQKLHYEQVQLDRKKSIQADQNMKKQKCEERKQYWQKIRQDISKRQEQRKINFEQQQQRLKDVKKSKKLYQILQQSWKNKIDTDKNKIKQATEHMRKNHKFDLTKIIQHQKEYEKTAKINEQKRQKSFQQFQEKVKISLPKLPHSKFLQTIKQEQKKQQNEELQRQKRKLQLSQRKHEFSTKVKQHYKPKIDEKLKQSMAIGTQDQTVQKMPGLPLGQIRNLGNDYMRKVHSTIALVRAARGEDSKVSKIEQPKKVQYKNYLADLKQKRNTEQIKSNLTNQVMNIMKNTNYSAVEKIQRAKLVAKRLQSKQNKKSSALINSINEKMKILRVLNNE